MTHCREQGFTLIEGMVAVAIIGILATLAYPGYKDYIIRGRIPEGLALLSNERVVMEKFFADNRVYSGVPAGGTTPVNACARYSDPNPAATKYFSVTCTAAATRYTLTASGIDSMAGFAYTIDETGAKQTTGVGAGWNIMGLPLNCWAIKKDGAC